MRKVAYILSLMLLSGCIKERQSDGCENEPNCTVRFALVDEQGADIFANEVQRVDLFIYNAQGITVHRSRIGRQELQKFAGKRLRLPVGDYSVVAWGNAMRSKVEDDTNGDPADSESTRVTTAVPMGDQGLDDGDPLYYAPRDRHKLPLKVVEDADNEVLAEMRHAHVKLDVTIEGWENLPIDPNAQSDTPEIDPIGAGGVVPIIAPGAPHVTVTDLASHYDFSMRGFGETVSYSAHAAAEDNAYKRRFNIPIFDRSTATRIIVSDNYGRPVHPDIPVVNLVPLKVDLDTVRRLPVTVRFYKDGDVVDASVTVDLPQWSEMPITPE